MFLTLLSEHFLWLLIFNFFWHILVCITICESKIDAQYLLNEFISSTVCIAYFSWHPRTTFLVQLRLTNFVVIEKPEHKMLEFDEITSVYRLLIYFENDSVFKCSINNLNFPMLHILIVCRYLLCFVFILGKCKCK